MASQNVHFILFIQTHEQYDHRREPGSGGQDQIMRAYTGQ